MPASAAASVKFGPYTLLRDQRLLMLGQEPVAIGSRALDILMVLIDAEAGLLSKDQLLALVWGDIVVDESTLRVHIAALRKALGDGRDGARYVINEQGRGYRFVAPLLDHRSAAPMRPNDRRTSATTRRLVGRDAIVSQLAELMPERGFMTLTGPGGIGKTSVAVAVAETLCRLEGYGHVFVDLAPIADATLVVGAIAARLEVAGAEDLQAAILTRLREAPVLLVLDNCEHVVDAVAELAETIHADGHTHILATSREPLRADGEWVHRLQPLAIPGREAFSAEIVADFPAVQLFIDRARAANDAFQLTDANAAAVAEICRRLDGMPLALELAAARIDAMGPENLAAHLDDRFSLLTKGRRSALPRQQTLRATLDWSYDLLPLPAQRVLNRLGSFAGAFTLEAACAVATCERIGRAAVLDLVNGLVSKSLVSVDSAGPISLYRLLDTMRAYAREKLADLGETDAMALRHAAYCQAQCADLDAAWQGQARSEWLAGKSRQVDDLRLALDWAFSSTGDLAVAVRLIVSSAPLWFHLSLPSEFLSLAERAIAVIPDTALQGSAEEMELRAAQGHALWHTRGPSRTMREAFDRALVIAENLADPGRQMRAHWGLWAQTILAGEYDVCEGFALNFKAIGADLAGGVAPVTADRMLALHRHFTGDQPAARALIDGVLKASAEPTHTGRANHAQVNGAVAANALRMRILWLQGLADQALATALDTVAAAQAADHDLTICYGLAIGAVPVALWVGRDDLARAWTSTLIDRARGGGMGYWEAWGQGFLAALDPAVQAPRRRTPMQAEGFATFNPSLFDPALLARLQEQPRLWCEAELLRLHALTAAAGEREDVLNRALASAASQGARAWELRAATDLARHWMNLGDFDRGRDLLARTLQNITEGFGTADVRAAQALLSSLSAAA